MCRICSCLIFSPALGKAEWKDFWQVIHFGHLGVNGPAQSFVELDKAGDGELA